MRHRRRVTERERRALRTIVADLAKVNGINIGLSLPKDATVRAIAVGVLTAERSCTGKAWYRDYATAEGARPGAERYTGVTLSSYACAFCARWHHATSKVGRARTRVQAIAAARSVATTEGAGADRASAS